VTSQSPRTLRLRLLLLGRRLDKKMFENRRITHGRSLRGLHLVEVLLLTLVGTQELQKTVVLPAKTGHLS
jgi:hypothetical protein